MNGGQQIQGASKVRMQGHCMVWSVGPMVGQWSAKQLQQKWKLMLNIRRSHQALVGTTGPLFIYPCPLDPAAFQGALWLYLGWHNEYRPLLRIPKKARDISN